MHHPYNVYKKAITIRDNFFSNSPRKRLANDGPTAFPWLDHSIVHIIDPVLAIIWSFLNIFLGKCLLEHYC